MTDRFEKVSDLIYSLTAALRHATQLELKLGHHIASLDTEAMLAEDLRKARVALASYHDLVKKKEPTHG